MQTDWRQRIQVSPHTWCIRGLAATGMAATTKMATTSLDKLQKLKRPSLDAAGRKISCGAVPGPQLYWAGCTAATKLLGRSDKQDRVSRIRPARTLEFRRTRWRSVS